jgi:hypothetical protein
MNGYTLNRILFFFILLITFQFIGCNTTQKDNPGAKTFRDSLEIKQIGKSNYFISIPHGYSITSKDGVDFSVYYFSPIDTSLKNRLAGGLYFGNFPHEFDKKNDNCKTEIAKGEILNITQNWTVYNCNETYSIQTIISSNSNEGWNQKIHAFGIGYNRNDLNKLLDVFSTLKKK